MRIRIMLAIIVVGILTFCEPSLLAKSATKPPPSKINDKYGYIDKQGKWAIKAQFDTAGSFTADGLAIVLKGKSWYFINKKGQAAITPHTTSGISELQGFSEGLAGVWLSNGKCGYIDRTGQFAIKPEYDYVAPFVEGRAKVGKGGLKGFVDKTGKVVVPIKYLDVNDFSEGRAAVIPDKKGWGYVNPDGGLVSDFLYGWAGQFSEGLAAVEIPSLSHIGYIDKDGKVVIAGGAFMVARPFRDGLAWVCPDKIIGINRYRGHNWGLINREGKMVLAAQFWEFGGWSDGMAAVVKGPLSVEHPSDLDNYKAGFVNAAGKIAIAPRFKSVGPFSEGLACVEVLVGKQAMDGFIDKTGRMVIKPRFEPTGNNYSLSLYNVAFSEGLCAVALGGKMGYINRSGKMVIKPQFGYAEPFSQGLALVNYSDCLDGEDDHPNG